jgi:hypothetical protein
MSVRHLLSHVEIQRRELMYRLKLIILFLVFASVSLNSCGGGGSGGSESVGGEPLPAKILSWNPPETYQDGSFLNPATDLDSFEIYIKETSNFADTDNEMAAVSATRGASGELNTSFNLANLAPFIDKGITYYVSIRAVAKNGLKSGFSPGASFSF